MATNQQNINIGTADNANDGDVLRAAFRKVRKMFAEIYGDTDAENLTDTEVVPSTNFDTHITEKIQDTVSGMFSSGTQTNVTVTYDDADGSIDLNVAADITDVNAGAGLTGVNEDGGAATINVGAGTGITVNADDIQIADGGVDTTQLADNAVTADKLADSINSEIAANTAKVTNATHTGDVTGSTALTIANDVVDYDKLAGEFTTASPLTAAADLDVDFSTAAVFTTTSSGPMDLNFTNAGIGQVKTIIVTDSGGTSSLTFDTGTNTVVKLNGDYSATAGAVNYIQAQCIAANSFILTISQAAA
jgi:hypothetical protein